MLPAFVCLSSRRGAQRVSHRILSPTVVAAVRTFDTRSNYRTAVAPPPGVYARCSGIWSGTCAVRATRPSVDASRRRETARDRTDSSRADSDSPAPTARAATRDGPGLRFRVARAWATLPDGESGTASAEDGQHCVVAEREGGIAAALRPPTVTRGRRRRPSTGRPGGSGGERDERLGLDGARRRLIRQRVPTGSSRAVPGSGGRSVHRPPRRPGRPVGRRPAETRGPRRSNGRRPRGSLALDGAVSPTPDTDDQLRVAERRHRFASPCVVPPDTCFSVGGSGREIPTSPGFDMGVGIPDSDHRRRREVRPHAPELT
jgi:hypothetical protein